MDVRLFLAIAAVIAVVYGIGFILIPSVVLGLYGVESSASAVLGFRYFGATLLSLGLANWIIRESSDWTAIRGLLIANAGGNIVGLVVSVTATLVGTMNGMGWSAVLIYLVLLLGYLYFLSVGARQTAR
jgi:hypothetical protein